MDSRKSPDTCKYSINQEQILQFHGQNGKHAIGSVFNLNVELSSF